MGKFVRLVAVFLVVGCAVCAVALGYWVELGLPAWRYENEALHAAIEAFGSVTALVLSVLFLPHVHDPAERFEKVWFSAGLFVMGVLDGVHALTPAGSALAYTHSLSTVSGGLFFALGCLPTARCNKPLLLLLPWLAAFSVIGLVLAELSWPPGTWTGPGGIPFGSVRSTSFYSVASSLLFVVPAIYLAHRGVTFSGGYQSLLLSSFAVLHVASGLLFVVSCTWGPAWWLLHVLRLVAFMLMMWLAMAGAFVQASRETRMRITQQGVGVLLERALASSGASALFGFYLDIAADLTASTGGLLVRVDGERKEMMAIRRPHWGQTRVRSQGEGTEVADELARTGIWKAVALGRDTVIQRCCGKREQPVPHFKEMPRIRSFMALPIAHGQRLFGVLFLFNRTGGYGRSTRGACDHLTAALVEGLVNQEIEGARRRHVEEREDWMTRLRTRMSELEASEARFRYLVERSADATLIVDLEGAVRFANPAAEQFYGRSTDVLVGLSVDSLATPRPEAQVCVHLPGKEPRWGDVRTVDTAWEGAPAFLVTVRDITQRKRAEEALQHHKEHLEELIDARTNELRTAVQRLQAHDREKSEFVSNVSHELRTPLTSMRNGMRNLIRGICGPLSSQVGLYVAMMLDESERLISTVEDILDSSRIETGRLKLYCMPLPIGEVCSYATRMLRVAAKAKSIVLRCECGGCRSFVDGDLTKLERVLVNVIQNAVKYTPDGGRVALHVEVRREGGVSIQISDNGPGIASDDLPHVLERYYRVGSHVDGTGLGLSIAAEIVRAHNGQIRVESPVPGQERGTRVTIELPSAATPVVVVVPGSNGSGEAAAKHLRAVGYTVEQRKADAVSGEALKTLGAALLLIDMTESGLGNLEALAHLRQQEINSDLPALVLTGESREESKLGVLKGLRGTPLAPPHTREALLRGIGLCLARRKDVPFLRADAGMETGAPGPQAAPAVPSL